MKRIFSIFFCLVTLGNIHSSAQEQLSFETLAKLKQIAFSAIILRWTDMNVWPLRTCGQMLL